MGPAVTDLQFGHRTFLAAISLPIQDRTGDSMIHFSSIPAPKAHEAASNCTKNKLGLTHLARTNAVGHGSDTILCNVVIPGIILTDMQVRRAKSDAKTLRIKQEDAPGPAHHLH